MDARLGLPSTLMTLPTHLISCLRTSLREPLDLFRRHTNSSGMKHSRSSIWNNRFIPHMSRTKAWRLMLRPSRPEIWNIPRLATPSVWSNSQFKDPNSPPAEARFRESCAEDVIKEVRAMVDVPDTPAVAKMYKLAGIIFKGLGLLEGIPAKHESQ